MCWDRLTGKSVLRKELKAFLTGKVIELKEVNDGVFSEGVIGEGVESIPENNTLYGVSGVGPNGEPESFYADGIEYYIIANNFFLQVLFGENSRAFWRKFVLQNGECSSLFPRPVNAVWVCRHSLIFKLHNNRSHSNSNGIGSPSYSSTKLLASS